MNRANVDHFPQTGWTVARGSTKGKTKAAGGPPEGTVKLIRILIAFPIDL